MGGRRLIALVAAALAAAGAVWSAQRLAALGAPILPPALAALLAPSLGRLMADALLVARLLGLSAAALAVGALQLAVPALAVLAALALLVAWRGPSRERPGTITMVRPPAGRARARSRCPACNARVQADWLTCPNCAASLPTARAS